MLRSTRDPLAVFTAALALASGQHAAQPVSPVAGIAIAPGAAMSPVAAEPAPLVQHLVAPQATDPAIDRALADHYVWLDTSARGNRTLLVFMPGTTGQPFRNQRFQQEAARLGYHVIGLMYQNDLAVDVACKGSPDRDCSAKMRHEIVDGIDRSSIVTVTPANGIDNRLSRLLHYLDHHFRHEGWSQFLRADGTPEWSRIVVGGQSQGSGQAAMIGKLRLVRRVLMFSGPPDARVPDAVDAWVSIGATPAARYFALYHQRDQYLAGIRANLAAFALERFGVPVIVELSDPPYNGTHILVTDLRPTLGYDAPNPHQSTANDRNTPLGPAGTPLLRDAWRYMLGERLDDDDDPNEP